VAKNLSFWGKWGRNVKFCFWDPKKHILRETTSFIVKIGAEDFSVRCRNFGQFGFWAPSPLFGLRDNVRCLSWAHWTSY